ncbi:MAG TPA: radical SAM protein [candidate division Zixibacteria bacterium]|nr:radical SAM protein [candidate division Zixibacteria bacterium]
MKVISSSGQESIATVFLAEMPNSRIIEFLESVQPPYPREKKWVLIVSTLYGCPVKCPICDAGGGYQGKLTEDEIFTQIDFLIKRRYPDFHIPAEKFKIQFARMGEPSFNMAVLDILEKLPFRYNAPGLMPCISSVAPSVSDRFFDRLLDIKEKHYRGRFQLQFSIHSTDEKERDFLIPVKKWSFEKIAEYGRRYFKNGDRKITLNFAPSQSSVIDVDVLKQHFDPELFFIKITPINPTYRAEKSGLSSYIDPAQKDYKYALIESLRTAGYEVLLSIGETAENQIGSNCGQYITQHLKEIKYKNSIDDSYTSPLREYMETC